MIPTKTQKENFLIENHLKMVSEFYNSPLNKLSYSALRKDKNRLPPNVMSTDNHLNYCLAWIDYFDEDMGNQWRMVMDKNLKPVANLDDYPDIKLFLAAKRDVVHLAGNYIDDNYHLMLMNGNMGWYGYFCETIRHLNSKKHLSIGKRFHRNTILNHIKHYEIRYTPPRL